MKYLVAILALLSLSSCAGLTVNWDGVADALQGYHDNLIKQRNSRQMNTIHCFQNGNVITCQEF